MQNSHNDAATADPKDDAHAVARPLRVLILHNYYQRAGGEDEVFVAESGLLESHGHIVTRLTAHNDTLQSRKRVAIARDTIWNRDWYRTIRDVVSRERIDIVHCHNTFPQISPAVYYAAHRAGAAVVQTLHNYRLTCVNGLLMRDGKPCEACIGKFAPWRGVVHRCYRDSFAASATVYAMLSIHRAMGTWSERIDRYIALTEFARHVFVRAGLPGDRISVKPQFVDGGPPPNRPRERFALFVGRLSEEKGVRPLLDSAAYFSADVPLVIVGDGPMRDEVRQACSRLDGVTWLGHRSQREVRDLMEQAAVLVLPSLWYEGFPRVLVEAYAAGLPVVASALGALTSVVRDKCTGVLVPPGNVQRIAHAVVDTVRSGRFSILGHAARQEYELRYTASANIAALMSIYREAIQSRASQARRAPSTHMQTS